MLFIYNYYTEGIAYKTCCEIIIPKVRLPEGSKITRMSVFRKKKIYVKMLLVTVPYQ